MRIIISTLSILLVSWLLPGVFISSIFTALLVAVLLSLLNMVVRPILVILTLPITFLTLGLFLLVINGAIVLLVSHFVHGFVIPNFFTAIIFSLLVSIVNGLLGINR